MNDAVLVGNALILAVASWMISKSIEKQGGLSTKTTLIRIHLSNSFIYAILVTINNMIEHWTVSAGTRDTTSHVLARDEYWYQLSACVTSVFTVYMDLLLIYLIVRFTRKSQLTNHRDSVLGRDVPSIVFFKNQALLKEAWIKKL